MNYTHPVFYTPYKQGVPKTSYIHIPLNNILHPANIPTESSRKPPAILNRSFLIISHKGAPYYFGLVEISCPTAYKKRFVHNTLRLDSEEIYPVKH